MSTRSIWTPEDWDDTAWYEAELLMPFSSFSHNDTTVYVHKHSEDNWVVANASATKRSRLTTAEAKRALKTKRDRAGNQVKLPVDKAQTMDSRYWYEITR